MNKLLHTPEVGVRGETGAGEDGGRAVARQKITKHECKTTAN